MVNRDSFNEIAFKIGIDKFVDYDKSSQLSKESSPDIFGNAFESFIGALYIDKGFKFTRSFIIKKIIKKHVDIDQVRKKELNFKGRLLEYCQKNDKEIVFEIEEENGNKELVYVAQVIVNGEVWGEGKGNKKKKAEQEASEVAYSRLKATFHQ